MIVILHLLDTLLFQGYVCFPLVLLELLFYFFG